MGGTDCGLAGPLGLSWGAVGVLDIRTDKIVQSTPRRSERPFFRRLAAGRAARSSCCAALKCMAWLSRSGSWGTPFGPPQQRPTDDLFDKLPIYRIDVTATADDQMWSVLLGFSEEDWITLDLAETGTVPS
jgi:hypothetical protein